MKSLFSYLAVTAFACAPMQAKDDAACPYDDVNLDELYRMAPSEDDEEEELDDEEEELSFNEVIASLRYFTPTSANKAAKYYLFIDMTSRCCAMSKMQEIVDASKAISATGTQIIYVSHDEDKEISRAFLKKHKAKFPGVMENILRRHRAPLQRPHYEVIPMVMIYDNKGKLLAKGGFEIYFNWADKAKK